MITTFSDLEVKLSDIINAYVQAPDTKKLYTILGQESSSDVNKTAVIVSTVYGLKSAGAAFRCHLAICMESMGNWPCWADPDLWIRSKTHLDGRVQYCSYLLCYVNNILSIHNSTDSVLQCLYQSFMLKPEYGKPDIYLGAKLHKTRLYNDAWVWAVSLIMSTRQSEMPRSN